jgi:hypothetical protein
MQRDKPGVIKYTFLVSFHKFLAKEGLLASGPFYYEAGSLKGGEV